MKLIEIKDILLKAIEHIRVEKMLELTTNENEACISELAGQKMKTSDDSSKLNDQLKTFSAGKKQKTSSITLTEAILESISDGVFTVDLEWRITFFNRAAEEITGISKSDATGRLCSDVFRSSMCGSGCGLRQTLKTMKPVIGKAGYIIKADGSKVPISVSTAVLRDSEGNLIGGAETFRDLSEIEELRCELKGKFRIGDIVSRSPIMQKLFEVLPAIAASPSTVLILGETGTGKELMAKAIHSLSTRCKGPFVAVNCGALPDTLLESELFGYKAGAFTGAAKDRIGRFALAKHGTIFLDEIGDISPALQTKLLRVLQEKTYEPLGSSKSEIADVRIIVATNRDLAEQMHRGELREDLYYRINVVRVELPPLKKRKEDIPLLAEHFIKKFNRLQDRSVIGITTEAISMLLSHDWPGNVRELENAIERAFILCGNKMIDMGHLPEDLTFCGNCPCRDYGSQSSHDLIETRSILFALEKNQNNRSAAARDLGIHKTTLFRKMKKLSIPLKKTKISCDQNK